MKIIKRAHKLRINPTTEQLIVLEDLCISGMLKNDKLAKHIADVGWHK